MSFAYNLKLARKRCGYTQTDVSYDYLFSTFDRKEGEKYI